MNKILLTLITLFSFSLAEAYTLNNNFGARFKSGKIKVSYAPNSICSKMTYYEMEEITKKAAEQFWNRVPTSSLSMALHDSREPIDRISTGRLCSPTDQTCINLGNLIPPVENIVVACNSLPENFGASNVLAVTIPNNFSGSNIKGALIIINDAYSNSLFFDLSKNDKVGVIAHEIGHALGLGHSDDKASLMYYRTTGQRTNLGQDDIDGATYLYPMQVDGFGLLGGCGTITTNKDSNPPSNPPFLQMGITLGLMILLFELIKRTKTRSAF